MTNYSICEHCKRPMRPPNTTLTQHPDTIAQSTKTACITCQKAIREGRTPGTNHRRKPVKRLTAALPPPPPNLTPQERANRNNLEALIHGRRNRGIPAQGRTAP